MYNFTIISVLNHKMNDSLIYKNSSIKIAYHKDIELVKNVRKVIIRNFDRDVSFYNRMEDQEFRGLILNTQKELNDSNILRNIVENIYDDLSEYLSTDKILVQTNAYLRVSRPEKSSIDSIGWHRENFYAPNADHYVNIWTPVEGVNENNTIRFIPNSQKIKNSDIKTVNIEDQNTKKFSTGHKIGLMYSPKKIISGVDLSSEKPMNIPYHSSSIFSGNLVHGAAKNTSQTMRFSLDFRAMSEKYFDKNLNKKVHFASGKSYFERFNK